MTTSAAEPSSIAGARWPQTVVGIAVVATALGLGWGALGISSDAGYGGVGPNFLPWLTAVGLLVCGALMLWEVRSGGFRQMDAPPGSERGDWFGFVWVSAGLLLNASLITVIGFILSCTLCYVFACQGLRRASGQAAGSPKVLVTDVVTGMVISAPVFWMFTQFLAINLPGITATGWI
ncbi:tripartite tricarboxylate transporter TctB family protein [Xylophilus sp. GOD-11R]|uniref:tripartite tricarboxylate transporter TctB family protein n=1 Tax=Xylophilus sp. GOD-11R TaxID=3089814 RepID=UPI00298C9CD4|nr:tripartite tricarboxylate transporter TctB family protein [Xylophilus sp. GOD-11R]WPB58806.1 tripartite tricarboxylate transporter TctB family protein [Xylophilus sp. GOD-11R]